MYKPFFKSLKRSYFFSLLIAFFLLFVGMIPAFTQTSISYQNRSDLLDFLHFSDGGDGFAGVAWFDYNNDGFLDIFFTNGKGHQNGLMRNNGDNTFTNVSLQTGVGNGTGNEGVVAADIDNDGNSDIFLTGESAIIGANKSFVKLYHNNGDGTFADITTDSGIVSSQSFFSAAFADINKDGFLDLFISGGMSFELPGRGENMLYLNNGDLTFTNISELAGIDTSLGGCAASFCDYNNDGLIDIFNANCADFGNATPIEVFRNNGDLTFTEVSTEIGLDKAGFWMGFASGDYDNDGDMDIFVTNTGDRARMRLGALAGGGWSLHSFYENMGDGTFIDRALDSGLAKWEFGWGCSFSDFDNDGFVDLFFTGSFPFPPAFIIGKLGGNPGRLFMNNQDSTFTESSSVMGITDLSDIYSSGVAVADFDNNGFPDISVAVNTYGTEIGKPFFFQNSGNRNSWLTIKLVGTVSNRDGIGARVKVVAGDLVQTRELRAGSSFLSMDSLWQTFGLLQNQKVDLIEIKWPSGVVDKFVEIQANQTITLVEGSGTDTSES